MQYRKLGNTDIRVSTICMGGWSIVGQDFTWGSQDRSDSIAAIHASLDAGMNFIDTAELYGSGESEELLAEALAGRRSDVVLATKVASNNLEEDKLRESCENSLRRLRTTYIDLYQVHWPRADLPQEQTMAVLEKLKKEGKIRCYGVSNYGPDYLREAIAAGDIISNQLPYSLLWRPVEREIQPLCVEANISILCYSPLCQGLLTGKFASADDVPATRARTRLFSSQRPHARHGQRGAEQETFAEIEKIRRLCNSVGKPMGQVALAWLLSRKGVTSVIAGARNAAQAVDNAAAAELSLSQQVLDELAAITQPLKDAMGTNADPWQAVSRMVH